MHSSTFSTLFFAFIALLLVAQVANATDIPRVKRNQWKPSRLDLRHKAVGRGGLALRQVATSESSSDDTEGEKMVTEEQFLKSMAELTSMIAALQASQNENPDTTPSQTEAGSDSGSAVVDSPPPAGTGQMGRRSLLRAHERMIKRAKLVQE